MQVGTGRTRECQRGLLARSVLVKTGGGRIKRQDTAILERGEQCTKQRVNNAKALSGCVSGPERMATVHRALSCASETRAVWTTLIRTLLP